MTANMETTHDQTTSSVGPFLKWAGGKRWFVERFGHVFPEFTGRYFEPFLGGGSVFFHLKPAEAVLSDANERLINCYRQIRDDYSTIETLLKQHQELHSREHYYDVRGTKFATPGEQAAQFLYLNRTCWNGLYRVNLKGEFNVPIGTKDKVVFEEEDLAAIAQTLEGVVLECCDFEITIDQAGDGDLLFVDPPYTVKHNYNGFLKYNEKIFSWDDQVRLRDAVARAAARGARILVTNAAHSSVEGLYEGLGDLQKVRRGSVLAGKKEARGIVEEILVSI